MSDQFKKLLQRLQLPQTADNEFIGGAGVGGVGAENRLYGGLVVAQAAVAAARTVHDMSMHSLHAYFLRPGRPDAPISLHVEHTKSGRNFHARLVRATQGEELIFQMMASFSSDKTESSPRHQDPMPDVPEPGTLPNRDQARGRKNWHNMTVDVRLCDPLTQDVALPPRKCVWLKPAGAMPADPTVHLGVLVFATDRAFLSTAWRPHAAHGQLRGASLDHSLWLHGSVVFDDWCLYQMHSPAAAHERGLVFGGIFNGDGQRIASVSQEGTLRHTTH